MTKIKVSKEVCRFLDECAKWISHHENWKDVLLTQHINELNRNFEGSLEKAKCMKDIAPMQLALILENGWEVEKPKYTQDNLPRFFEYKIKDDNNDYKNYATIHGGYVYSATVYTSGESIHVRPLETIVNFLNGGHWIIVK